MRYIMATRGRCFSGGGFVCGAQNLAIFHSHEGGAITGRLESAVNIIDDADRSFKTF